MMGMTLGVEHSQSQALAACHIQLHREIANPDDQLHAAWTVGPEAKRISDATRNGMRRVRASCMPCVCVLPLAQTCKQS